MKIAITKAFHFLWIFVDSSGTHILYAFPLLFVFLPLGQLFQNSHLVSFSSAIYFLAFRSILPSCGLCQDHQITTWLNQQKNQHINLNRRCRLMRTIQLLRPHHLIPTRYLPRIGLSPSQSNGRSTSSSRHSRRTLSVPPGRVQHSKASRPSSLISLQAEMRATASGRGGATSGHGVQRAASVRSR